MLFRSLTIADAAGNVVSSTQTLNKSFGARFIVPGTGMIPNNYMINFDPRPGNALSIAPGKRVTTSASPMMALRDGKLRVAFGLPGGKKIFPSAMQAGQQNKSRRRFRETVWLEPRAGRIAGVAGEECRNRGCALP